MTDKNLSQAIDIVKNNVYSEFEKTWKDVVETEPPEYRILIWGSIVDDRDRDPVDMDIIVEYTGDTIDPDKENSIESILKNSIYTTKFSYIDPLVTHHLETPTIIANSRVSKTYSVDEDGWLEF